MEVASLDTHSILALALLEKQAFALALLRATPDSKASRSETIGAASLEAKRRNFILASREAKLAYFVAILALANVVRGSRRALLAPHGAKIGSNRT